MACLQFVSWLITFDWQLRNKALMMHGYRHFFINFALTKLLAYPITLKTNTELKMMLLKSTASKRLLFRLILALTVVSMQYTPTEAAMTSPALTDDDATAEVVPYNHGYDLWLGYSTLPASYRQSVSNRVRGIYFPGSSATIDAAKAELVKGIAGLMGDRTCANGVESKRLIPQLSAITDGCIVAGTPKTLPADLNSLLPQSPAGSLQQQGYVIASTTLQGKQVTAILSPSEVGMLYGVFHYLRLLKTQQPLDDLHISEAPKIRYRMLNHWDNLNGTIERGYAGYTIWGWERLPHFVDHRLIDYARANASVGINGVVLNNVNTPATLLKTEWLVKVAKLADTFRPYGIRVFLSVNFSSPMLIGGLKTADPKDPKVQQWWKDKADEIYQLIPDFGGFLVKANSEGRPGPLDYGRTHADGANMLADALAPHGGVVFWRAFVYKNNRKDDRVVTGYNEFKPLNGQFRDNVSVQVKYGAIDFQPREPFHPLFGQMANTNLSLELQITLEYLGHAGHLVYLGPLWSEILQSDTYANGKGSTVSKVLQDYDRKTGLSGIAGVSNIGSDLNWTGHPFGQANWYAFGRLCWNPDVTPAVVADSWIRMTMGNDSALVARVKKMMMMSHEATVNYEMPLGLTHMMSVATHLGPEPWHKDPVWTAFDYHKVTNDSIGVDRTTKGSNAVGQYHKPVTEVFNSLKKCPEKYLLWFHRLPWDYKMKSGKTLWDELVEHYYLGVEQVKELQSIWQTTTGKVDDELYNEVSSLLRLQETEAEWWRDACVLFFQEYSRRPLPAGYAQPKHPLDYYKKIPYPYDWDHTQLLKH